MKVLLNALVVLTAVMLGSLSCLTLKKATYTVSGLVSDSETREPVVNCLVTIADKTDRTDANGHYQIGELPSGMHDIKFDAGHQYYTYSTTIDVHQADKTFDAAIEFAHSEKEYIPIVIFGEAGASLDAELTWQHTVYTWLKETEHVQYGSTSIYVREGAYNFEVSSAGYQTLDTTCDPQDIVVLKFHLIRPD